MGNALAAPHRKPLCEREANGARCTKGFGGGPAPGVDQVTGRWYCAAHLPGAKAVAEKRRDRGFGACSVQGCSRPAVEEDGKCSEHRAGERAANATMVVVAKSGKGDHPYAPKRTEIYLSAFFEFGLIKVGKATPWTVRSRVREAAKKLRIRQTDTGSESPIACEPRAWAVTLFGDENTLWAVSERVEHAAAGRLAHNVGATSVDHTEGKEWLRHDAINEIDWEAELYRAVRETLTFLGHNESDAGRPWQLN